MTAISLSSLGMELIIAVSQHTHSIVDCGFLPSRYYIEQPEDST